MNEQYPHIDKHFKKYFEDFNVEPRPELWDDISIEMDTQPIDKAFEQNFSDFEVEPGERVWDNVSKQLPLNLLLKRHLHRLSKVAAILLFIMVSITFFHNKESNQILVLEETPPIEQPDMSGQLSSFPEQDFVFELETTDEEKIEISKERIQEINRKKRARQLWKSILEEEDDFVGINKAKIEEILKPLKQLPIEDFAEVLENEEFDELPGVEHATPDITDQQAKDIATEIDSENIVTTEYEEHPEGELKIWIPLKVVEDYEIESMIQAYHQNELNRFSKSN